MLPPVLCFCEIITFSKVTSKKSEITKFKFLLACDNMYLVYCSSLCCHEDEGSVVFQILVRLSNYQNIRRHFMQRLIMLLNALSCYSSPYHVTGHKVDLT